jgi:hypothetical protein
MFYQLGQTEVCHVRPALAIEQDVTGLQVAVQDPALVRVMNGASDTGDKMRRFIGSVADDVRCLTLDFGLRPSDSGV